MSKLEKRSAKFNDLLRDVVYAMVALKGMVGKDGGPPLDTLPGWCQRLRAKLRKARRPGRVLARRWWCPTCRELVASRTRCGRNGAAVVRIAIVEVEGKQ